MSASAIYRCPIGHQTYQFRDLKDVMAKASPARSGDALAGLAAGSMAERVAAQTVLADVSLADFVAMPLIPYEQDEVTRLIVDSHDAVAFAPVAGLTVGEFRDWLLARGPDQLTAIARGLTPEMVAAVSKLMRNQDLILVASRIRVVTAFRNTLGLSGRFSVRLQPNHPTDALPGIAASTLDGLLLGAGDACIGVNPAGDNPATLMAIWQALDSLIARFDIPTQSCVLAHVTQQLAAIEAGAPVDLIFQSIAGTEQANRSFGIDLALLREAQAAGR